MAQLLSWTSRAWTSFSSTCKSRLSNLRSHVASSPSAVANNQPDRQGGPAVSSAVPTNSGLRSLIANCVRRRKRHVWMAGGIQPEECEDNVVARTEPFPLFDLPLDVVRMIVNNLTHVQYDGVSGAPQQIVTQRSYLASLNFSKTSHRASDIYFGELRDVSLAYWSARDMDKMVRKLVIEVGRRSLQRLVLRGAIHMSNRSMVPIARYARSLRWLDLSFVTTINAVGLSAVCKGTAATLRVLLLRGCTAVSDESFLDGISECHKVVTLDVAHCPNVTDWGLCVFLANGVGPTLRKLSVAYCPQLTNTAWAAIGARCKELSHLCARGLPRPTDAGFAALCAGHARTGRILDTIDVTECPRLTIEATVRTLVEHCPRVSHTLQVGLFGGGGGGYSHGRLSDLLCRERTLRQVLINSLRHNLAVVRCLHPYDLRPSVFVLLLDLADRQSIGLVPLPAIDPTLFGIILWHSYGSTLPEQAENTLKEQFGVVVGSGR